MFPLDCDTVPITAADWRGALVRVLTRWVSGGVHVGVDGEPPAVAGVDVDVSGGRLSEGPVPDVTIVGGSEPGPTVGRFHAAAAAGRPLIVRGVAVSFDVSAEQARFDLGRNAAGQPVVSLAGAGHGKAWVHLAPADLESALLLAARAGAAPHGVAIQSVKANLTAGGPRTVDLAMDVTAKKFVAFTLRITGRVSVDDEMAATATELRVAGTGMAAGFAAGIIRPQLAELEGQRLPLAAFGLGDVRLHDVAVDVTDGLRLTATFGGAA